MFLDASGLSDVRLANPFSQSVACLFVPFVVSFFLSFFFHGVFQSANFLNFDKGQCIDSFF